MKRRFVGTTIAAALWFAAPSWAQRAEAPLPPQPGTPPAASQAAPYAQPPPRIEMPASQQQAGGETAEPSPPRHRAHRRRVMQAAQVNRSVANGFTAELNRRELESLGSGGGAPPAETAPPPWRDLYPPR